MEITSQRAGDFVDVTVIGRLDGYWADHLTKGLEDIMRQGADRIRLNLSGVTYISSMGIRVLVQFHKKLHSIHGIFLVSSPSDPVKRVLSMTGLQDVLMPATSSRAQAVARQESIRRLDRKNSTFEIFEYGAPGSVQRGLRRTIGPTRQVRSETGNRACRADRARRPVSGGRGN